MLIRLPQVQQKVPYSRSTIYLKMSRGEFPKPVSLGGNAVAWLASEIDDWIAGRMALRQSAAQPFAQGAPNE